MLFNSYEFIFVFLPITLLGFFIIARRSHIGSSLWLGLASLFFYGWWSLEALPLLIGSICANYWFGLKLSQYSHIEKRGSHHNLFFIVTLASNLALLGYFKYANFFIDTINLGLAKASIQTININEIVLPIGISFFTFTQIAFLVDCWQGKVKEKNFFHYLLFVTYFPHLIAGPVLHHSQMMPQFRENSTYQVNYSKCIIGIIIFTIGLSKKILLADPLSVYADSLFNAANNGTSITFFDSWFGIFAYALQIYFDFSGYSDMAIGISLLFNIDLPINFQSPYRATSIIDFWRRWHISLSTFLRDYLYIPLGGGYRGRIRRYMNLLITMLLGGLWHGANWTFVLWGACHGLFLIVNHGWRKVTNERNFGLIGAVLGWGITFISVCLAWVLFRASNTATASSIYLGMINIDSISWQALFASFNSFLGANEFNLISSFNFSFSEKIFLIIGWLYSWGGKILLFGNLHGLDLLILGFILTLTPFNSNKIANFIKTEPEGSIGHQYKKIFMYLLSLISLILITKCLWLLNKHTVFIYFQF